MIRLNEMILAPIIAFTLAFVGKGSLMMVLSAATTAHKAWSQWIEYQDLRFEIHRMFLITMLVGGPFIRTNDPTYQAYVYADAVVRQRTGMLRRSALRPHSSEPRPTVPHTESRRSDPT
jgi:hypothetical protein